ncbi:MAG TPA: UbiA prenyltransferase family protein [Pirellulales bacterium]|jgi:4-hydroxybenzoate polyprenyltransferase|nr:UbiA prenyltransferase family protein [Pirellulales bacterium]
MPTTFVESPPPSSDLASPASGLPNWLAYVQIARPDHWVKNVFVLPGVLAAVALDWGQIDAAFLYRLLMGLAATCLVASSNYVLNELLDAPSDRYHPIKRQRPVPSARVNIRLACAEWLLLFAVGLGVSWLVSAAFTAVMVVLWIMGCLYNVPPVRTKEVAFIDVVSEAVNNPLRMLAGWYIAGTPDIPPVSLLASYWMIGCYFMAIKRYAELREIDDPTVAASYRKSFAYYTPDRLLVSIMFYGSAAMLFFGAFLVRYRLELVLAFPLVAIVMAVYLSIAFRPNSAAQAPERLFREPWLMASVVACTVVLVLLLVVDLPFLYKMFAPTIPLGG